MPSSSLMLPGAELGAVNTEMSRSYFIMFILETNSKLFQIVPENGKYQNDVNTSERAILEAAVLMPSVIAPELLGFKSRTLGF